MEQPCCGNCKHFRLHYIKYASRHYHPLHYGHCVKSRLKKREKETKACTHWQCRKEEASW